jgi:hypothetical protein
MRVALVHESLTRIRYDKVLPADGADGADEPGSRHEIESTYQVQNQVSSEQLGGLRLRTLAQRGDITLWISEDAIATWKPAPSGRPRAQKKFSDHAIETALTLRLVFKLPLHQAEGFLPSVLSLMGVHLEAPDHTSLSRRSQRLDLLLSPIPAVSPIDLIVDSTGLSIVGEGEWAASKYGGRGRRESVAIGP